MWFRRIRQRPRSVWRSIFLILLRARPTEHILSIQPIAGHGQVCHFCASLFKHKETASDRYMYARSGGDGNVHKIKYTERHDTTES